MERWDREHPEPRREDFDAIVVALGYDLDERAVATAAEFRFQMAKIERLLDRYEFKCRRVLDDAAELAASPDPLGAVTVAWAITGLRAVITERACNDATDDDDLDQLVADHSRAADAHLSAIADFKAASGVEEAA